MENNICKKRRILQPKLPSSALEFDFPSCNSHSIVQFMYKRSSMRYRLQSSGDHDKGWILREILQTSCLMQHLKLFPDFSINSSQFSLIFGVILSLRCIFWWLRMKGLYEAVIVTIPRMISERSGLRNSGWPPYDSRWIQWLAFREEGSTQRWSGVQPKL